MPKLVAEPEVSPPHRIWTLPSVWMFYNQNLSHSSQPSCYLEAKGYLIVASR